MHLKNSGISKQPDRKSTEKVFVKKSLFFYITIPTIVAFFALLMLGMLQSASAESGLQRVTAEASNVIQTPSAEIVYTVVLSGTSEVPGPGDNDGTGTIQISINESAGEVCYSLDYENITAPSAGHIHTGDADASGGVLVGLFSAAADAANGCATGVPAADIAAIVADPAGHYVNIHNADFPAGAIRGQLGGPATVLYASLTGAAEVPGPGDDDGFGGAMISVDAVQNMLCYEIAFDQIDGPSAGHIHTGGSDAAGGVLIGLFSDVNNAGQGCVTNIPAADVTALLTDPAGHYVNLHNAAFAAGAIRGQLSSPITMFNVALSGAAEIPGPGDDDGSGTIQLAIDAAAGEVCYSLDFADITDPSAGHIHTGAVDESGGVLVGLFSAAADAGQGCAIGVSAADIAAILANPAGHYINIHNADFPAGAIRGQMGAPATVLYATLTGAAEVPGPGDEDGSGSAIISIDAALNMVCYELSFDQIDAPSAGHIHTGGADAAGGVLIGLFSEADDAEQGCVVDVPAADIATVLADPAGHYVNLHNAAFAAGAIRGQLGSSVTTFDVVLTGAAEVPGPGDEDGSGSVTISIDAALNTVCYDLAFSQIDAPSAGHIHTGDADESGNVLVGLFSDGANVSQGCVTGVSDADISTMLSDPAGHYVNIHNAAFPAGAIRGQLVTAGSATVTVAHFAPFSDSIDGTSVTVRVNGSDVITDLKFSEVVNDLTLPVGEYLIEVLPTGTSTVAISTTVTLVDGEDYTVSAIGNSTNQPLELFALVDDNEPSSVAANAKIRIAHLAPFADTLAGTAVDICTDAGVAIQSGVQYKVHTDPYLELPAGDYDLKIALSADGCATTALDIAPITLEAGEVYDVFAIGDVTNQPLRTATTSGLTLAATPTDLGTIPEPGAAVLDHQLFLPMMNLQ